MFSNDKLVKTAIVAGSFFLLTACSGEPSDSDIKNAVTRQMQAEADAVKKFGGSQAAGMMKDMMPDIKSVKKIGCKADGDKAYKCDVELEVTQMGNTNKGVAPMRFVKGSDGWMAAR